MADKIKLVRDDTRPMIKIVLTDETTGAIVPVPGATVVMKFRALGTTVILTQVPGLLQPGLEQEDGTVILVPPYDVPGSGGRVVFQWAPGDLNVEPGDYEGEVEVTFQDATIQTVYETQKFKVREDF